MKMPSDERKNVTRAAGVVGAATLTSRILGFLRDVVIAYFLGTAASADAFFVAFRLPNLLRRLFAEGSFTVAFIPVFTETLTRQGKPAAMEAARSVLTLQALFLMGVTALGLAFAPALVHLIAPGFTDDPGKLEITVELTRITFPYIFFIGLVAGCMGVLNSLGHFAAPAAAPALLNLSMIAAVFSLGRFMKDPAFALAWGVVAGGLVQLLLQVPFMSRQGFSFRPSFHFRHPALMKILKLMAPTVLGAAVYQVNVLVGTLLASLLAAGSVSYLYYADRLVQFPLGIFAIALGTASLPSMSRHVADGDMHGFVRTFSYSLRLLFFITFPCMAGLIALRDPMITVLFQRGAFDHIAAEHTASALLYYALGLWAFSGVRILLSGFFALQDSKTPAGIAILALLANIGLSVALMGPLEFRGLALANSLSSAINFGLLIMLLRKKIHRMDGRNILRSLAKTTTASVGLAATALLTAKLPLPGGAALHLLLQMLVGGITFLLLAVLLRCPEIELLYRPLAKKLGKSGSAKM